MINLDNVGLLWDMKCIQLIEELNDLELDDSPTTSSSDKAKDRTFKAEVSRQLLELADTLALMESLVRNEYWWLKGKGLNITIEEIS